MLFQVSIKYQDGRTETNIVTNPTIYPKRDKITFAGCKPFKYKSNHSQVAELENA